MRKQEKKQFKIAKIAKEHVINNFREYLIVSTIFLIGIVIGILYINNYEMQQKAELKEYLNGFTNSLNQEYQIDTNALLKTSIINNLLLAISLWFIGSTVIGIPIVYMIIALRGFTLGYTISSAVITYSVWKGALFSVITLLLQNILFIPAIFALAVSGIKLYKSIMKDKRRENIKIEILRHTVFSLFMAGILIISSFVEAYISGNLLTLSIKLFA